MMIQMVKTKDQLTAHLIECCMNFGIAHASGDGTAALATITASINHAASLVAELHPMNFVAGTQQPPPASGAYHGGPIGWDK
mgnify:FL=1